MKHTTFYAVICILLTCAGCSRNTPQPETPSEQKKPNKVELVVHEPTPPTLFKKHLFDVFDVIETNLRDIDFATEREKALTEAKTLSIVKEYIAKELKENPQALYAEGEYGLTPAHQLVLDCLFYTRRLHWDTGGLIIDSHLVKRVVAEALKELRTEKKVLARTSHPNSGLFRYLQTLGMDKKALSEDEMQTAWRAIGDPNAM